MSKKSLLLIAFIICLIYSTLLTAAVPGLMDVVNPLKSSHPLHAISLGVAVVITFCAYLYKKKEFIIGAWILTLFASATYIPVSLIMIIPLGFITLAYFKPNPNSTH